MEISIAQLTIACILSFAAGVLLSMIYECIQSDKNRLNKGYDDDRV
jgi:hypothetical protein